jgi:ABC-type spermidine/putrescine transport system permease subunit I
LYTDDQLWQAAAASFAGALLAACLCNTVGLPITYFTWLIKTPKLRAFLEAPDQPAGQRHQQD